MKKDKILSNILFFFGIVLLFYSLFAFIYQTILTSRIDWSALRGDELVDTRTYVMLEYVTIAFKMVIASYGIYSKKHVDESINPLFTFTVFYVLFVTLQTMSLFNTLQGATIREIANHYKFITATAAIDLIVAVFYLVVTILLKLDDWRSIREDEA